VPATPEPAAGAGWGGAGVASGGGLSPLERRLTLEAKVPPHPTPPHPGRRRARAAQGSSPAVGRGNLPLGQGKWAVLKTDLIRRRIVTIFQASTVAHEASRCP